MRCLGLLLACVFVVSAVTGCEPSSPGGTQPATPESNVGAAPTPPTPPAEPTGAAPTPPSEPTGAAPTTPTGTSAIAPGEPHPQAPGSGAPATTPPPNRPCIDIRAALVRCPEGDSLSHEGCDGPEYMKRCLPKAAQKK